LLQRDVRAGLSLPQGVLVDHVERDRGLHRPRFTGEEDDLTDRDAAVEFLVEPVDERTDSVPLGHAVVSIGRCGYNRSEAVIRGEQRLRTGEKTKKERGSNRELKCEGGSGIVRFVHSNCVDPFGWNSLFVIRFVYILMD